MFEYTTYAPVDSDRLASLKLAASLVENDPRLIALHKGEPPSPYLSRNTASEANKKAAQPQIEDLVVHIAKRLQHYLESGE